MTVLALVSLAIWVVLLFARGSFWRVAPDMLGEMSWASPSEGSGSTVVAIVPARNEADVLAETLPTLLVQDLPVPFQVILVDDHSEDGTRAAALECAARCGQAKRLTVVSAPPLGPGWTGKLAAMRAGLDHLDRTGNGAARILFTDADIAYRPGTLRRLLAESERRGTVLASLMVRLRTVSTAERWLVPPFVYFFKMLYPFAWVSDPARATAAAAGGVMLCDRAALQRAGGLAAIRDALIDDCALGALMKHQGPVWLGLTRDVESRRGYPRFADIKRMVVRSADTELRHSLLRLVAALLGLSLVFVEPPAATLFGSGPGRIAGLAAWIAMAVSFAPMLRLYGLSLWRSPALPCIAMIYGLFTLQSAIAYRRGRGGVWKGRVQAPAHEGRS